MKLEERLKQLPEKIGSANWPSDWFISNCLITARVVLILLREDLQENEPYARRVIADMDEVRGNIPDDMDAVRALDEMREKGV